MAKTTLITIYTSRRAAILFITVCSDTIVEHAIPIRSRFVEGLLLG